uniref:Putative secreted protein n=1 Tax=Anopheles marajoara TaxID=58244 RepID=A0A2M4CDT4_9DIPT
MVVVAVLLPPLLLLLLRQRPALNRKHTSIWQYRRKALVDHRVCSICAQCGKNDWCRSTTSCFTWMRPINLLR